MFSRARRRIPVALGTMLWFLVSGFWFSSAFAQQTTVPDADQFVGAPKGTPLAGAQLDQRTQQVAGGIRCPVCQGLSVADSPSEMAVNMKAQVRALLARGYTQQQIETYFERSYGQFVLLRPKFQGVNVLVWILPAAALILGVAIVFSKLRKLSTGNRQPTTDNSSEPDDEYLARVRELLSEAKS